jgi:adenylate cyclase
MEPETGGKPFDDEYWREYLTRGGDATHAARRLFTRLPSDPRCRLCTAPFSGAGGRVMRLIGRRPSDANPNVCTGCQNHLIRHHGGAEVEGTMLFADIRGSTALAEAMSPGDFHRLLERFYGAASRAVFEHDGAIDKFVGDELVAMFYPGLAGERHVARAIEAAQAVIRMTGHGTEEGPWVPVGAGVHTGLVWFGAVGTPPHVELTSLGDTVNTAARLAAAAGAGEVLVSAEAARAAGLADDLERRRLTLKGKQEPFDVVVVTNASS